MIFNIAKNAKSSSVEMKNLTENQRMKILEKLSELLLQHQKEILAENHHDVMLAEKNNLSMSLLDRLKITESNIKQWARSCLEIANFPQVTGTVLSSHTTADGLVIEKHAIPIGVIALIFESRPNVVIDASALAIKSGNNLIFKGGSEAKHSNAILCSLVQEALQNFVTPSCIQMITARADVLELLQLHQFIDVVIPRGGSQLISFVKKNASMPVIAHDRGLNHLYIHEDADIDLTIKVVINSKVQRAGVCNAVETILIHKNFSGTPKLLQALLDQNVSLKVSSEILQDHPLIQLAQDEDYHTEWLAKVLNVRIVANCEDAIIHIRKHGSHHTEGILAQDVSVIEAFINAMDASCITVNASTRLNDGGQLGLGAELGISTSKLHAYGPMGAKEMTTYCYVLKGQGHIRK